MQRRIAERDRRCRPRRAGTGLRGASCARTPVESNAAGSLGTARRSGCGSTLSADLLFFILNEARPTNAVLIQESPSNLKALHLRWHITQPDAYYTMASGGLGYGLPAAVGIALAERRLGRHRPVIAIIGDGSFHYCVQALWTAAQHVLTIVFVVPDNAEYAILKSFADREKTAGLPGLDLPGMDLATIARGYGCAARRVETPAAVEDALLVALQRKGPTVLIAPISAQIPPLL